jgi:hypothetical protein
MVLVPPYGADVMVGAGLGRNCDDRTVMGHTRTGGQASDQVSTAGQTGIGDPTDMSLEAHHLTMGNSIIGSRRITDTNPGPATLNRPAHTHNSIIPTSI